MKILMITATYPPSANGVAVVVSNYYKQLRKMGHEVWVLAPENNLDTIDPVGVVRYPSITNPIIEDYPIPLFPLSYKVLKLLRTKTFDIVHAHHPFYISYFADLVSHFSNAPLVFTYHTRYSEYAKIGMKLIPKRFLRQVEKYTFLSVFKKSDLVISPSTSIKKYLTTWDVDCPIEVIPSGLPTFKIPSLTKFSLRKKYKLPQDKHILLCVSRIGIEKNLILLLKMLKLLPSNYHLLLVGMGPQLAELKQLSIDMELSNRVTFLGKVPYERIPEIYSLSDTFVFSSTTETQGMVLLEAQYFGLPVVAVKNVVNSEWVGENCGLISKNSSREMKNSVIKLQKKHKTYSQNARRFARNYTTESSSNKLIYVYEKLIKKGKKRKSFITKFSDWISRVVLGLK